MFVVSRAVALGREAALVTVAGNALGIYVQVVLVAAGLGVVVERSVAAFTAVKLFGAAYLVWFGIQAVRRRRSNASVVENAAAPAQSRSLFVADVVVGLANPTSYGADERNWRSGYGRPRAASCVVRTSGLSGSTLVPPIQAGCGDSPG
jgi:threonine/homoserine/homoserine lactone efflux protein